MKILLGDFNAKVGREDIFKPTIGNGHAIAEVVSRWLPTAAVRVRAWVWQVGFVVGKVASGQVFSEYFGFPCQNHSFHQLLHHHHSHVFHDFRA
jgi:hypothetical protein